MQQDEQYKASHINLKSHPRILSTILHLMAILIPRKSTKSEATSPYERHIDYTWAVEILTRSRLLLQLGLEEEGSGKRSSSSNSVLFLQVLRDALSCIVSFGTNNIMSLQLSKLLCQSIKSALLSSSQFMTLPLEHAVCWSISDLYTATIQSSVILGIFHEYLQPLIQETIGKSDLFEKFNSDLQVSRGIMLLLDCPVDLEWQHTLIFITYLNPNPDEPTCSTRVIAELDYLQDQDLKESFKHVSVKTHDIVRIMRHTRPRKRLRVSETKAAQVSITAEQILTQRIYTLFGVPIAPGLEGLNQLAL